MNLPPLTFHLLLLTKIVLLFLLEPGFAHEVTVDLILAFLLPQLVLAVLSLAFVLLQLPRLPPRQLTRGKKRPLNQQSTGIIFVIIVKLPL